MPTKQEIDQFIAVKRASKELRDFWGRQVVQAGLALIDQRGQFTEIKNITTKPKIATVNGLEIMLTTPSNLLEIQPCVGTGYMMDIWHKEKVFWARWEPLEINRFKRGDWLYLLFDESGKGTSA